MNNPTSLLKSLRGKLRGSDDQTQQQLDIWEKQINALSVYSEISNSSAGKRLIDDLEREAGSMLKLILDPDKKHSDKLEPIALLQAYLLLLTKLSNLDKREEAITKLLEYHLKP